MVSPINLNKARKARVRLRAEVVAAENRLKFGRSKAARANDLRDEATVAKRLDGHKLGGSDEV